MMSSQLSRIEYCDKNLCELLGAHRCLLLLTAFRAIIPTRVGAWNLRSRADHPPVEERVRAGWSASGGIGMPVSRSASGEGEPCAPGAASHTAKSSLGRVSGSISSTCAWACGSKYLLCGSSGESDGERNLELPITIAKIAGSASRVAKVDIHQTADHRPAPAATASGSPFLEAKRPSAPCRPSSHRPS